MSTLVEPAVAPDSDPARASSESSRRGLVFAATILVSAFLLFEVQPLISKFILPWFGGSPAVWTTAMLFFQVVLFAGYSYAHLTTWLLGPKAQMVLHLVLLAAAVSLLPIAPDVAWKPIDAGEPTWRILALLTVCVGLPYLVLASTGPLVQAWFARVYPQQSPYRLYALSNVGSLAALLSYPFYFERALDTQSQAGWWSAGFVLFALLCAACAIRTVRSGASSTSAATTERAAVRPTSMQRGLWLALPALASVMLLATTNHVCQDVAVIPFLWVVPLALYLLTFIIAFDHQRWYHRRATAAAAALTLLAAGTIGVWYEYLHVHFLQELVLYFGGMFLLCMMCHGELVRLKPDPKYLTSFYLMISAGGALGGIFVSLLAPQIFNEFWEWPLAVDLGFLLALGLLLAPREGRLLQRPQRIFAAAGLAVVGLVVLMGAQRPHTPATSRQVEIMRNFYGVASVYERSINDPSEHDHALFNGSIMHGAQYVDPVKSHLPITYYTPKTGIGRTINLLKAKHDKLRVATVGLGIGTIAAFARPGDKYTFYEINPDVETLARRHFHYLGDAGDAVEVLLGDARITLDRQEPQQFDLIVLDAFSGDAVPAHLLTSEAFDIYLKHLNPEHGTIIVHITNTYLELAPLVRGFADKYSFDVARLKTDADYPHNINRTDQAILSRDKALINDLLAAPNAAELTDQKIVWTDQSSNLFEILK